MTTTITARVDSERKIQAEEVLSDLGLTFSSAINLFVNAVIMAQGIPFKIQRRFVRQNGVKIGLAKDKWKLPEDFDDKFDSYDAEIADELSGGSL